MSKLVKPECFENHNSVLTFCEGDLIIIRLDCFDMRDFEEMLTKNVDEDTCIAFVTPSSVIQT